MPIYEYACEDCGTQFEKLIRRSEDVNAIECPSCTGSRLATRYSTFAAHADSGRNASMSKAAGETGGCGGGMCQGGFCGMSPN